MKSDLKNNGNVLLLTIFVVALLSAVTMGLIEVNTAEMQVMHNQVYAAEAQAIAEAGLNDVFSQLRGNSSWDAGFTNKAFAGGSYTVVVSDFDASAESGPVPPDVTDNELDVTALGPVYPDMTQNFSVSHPSLDDDDFDSRTTISITAGSYSYSGGMSGSPFALAIPANATEVSMQIILKKQDYPQISANVNCQVMWVVSQNNGSPLRKLTIVSEATSARGFVSRVAADVTAGNTSPYKINMTEVRINE